MSRNTPPDEVFHTEIFTKTSLEKVNEDLWIYTRSFDWKSFFELWTVMAALGVITIALFTLLDKDIQFFSGVVGVAGFLLLLLCAGIILDFRKPHTGKHTRIAINREQGVLYAAPHKQRGGHIEEYSLQEFRLIRMERRVEKQLNPKWPFWMIVLEGKSSRFELCRCSYEYADIARTHCRELAAFLHVEFRDESPFTIIFGKVPLSAYKAGRILADPDFEFHEVPLSIARVYIDPQTAQPLLVEKFITYLLNYPPGQGIQAVKIFYQGELNDLGEHLANALRNTFDKIEQIV
jgi:hypothetical protein